MNKRKNFEIGRIEEEPKKKNAGSRFVSPYGGSNTKDDNIVYPYIEYGNGGRQYKGLDNEKNSKEVNNDLKTITIDDIDNKKKEEKYSPERIPSYYRRESGSGITSSSLTDLRGGSPLDKEAELEKNRRTYGSYYRRYNEEEVKLIDQEVNRNVIVDKLNKKEEVADYQEVITYDSVEETKETLPPKHEDKFFAFEEPASTSVKYEPKVEVKKPEQKVFEIEKQYVQEPIPTKENKKPRKPSKYVYPPLDLLERKSSRGSGSQEEIKYQISVINKELEDFKIGGHVVDYTKGPTVTQFEVKLDPGVNVSKINTITKNLQMDLKCVSIRIEAPIPGKPTIGIEVPNITKDIVLFGDLLEQEIKSRPEGEKNRNGGKPVDVILGLSISGEPVHMDINKMPHGIIAGATGSGKTICLYSIICSLIFKSTPDEVKLILVDPKKNELMYFEDIPHLATPIIVDPKLAAATLKWCIDEMDRRYDFLTANRKRTIGHYNEYAVENGYQIIPYIVVVIDEFADLMQTASDSLESNVQRLAQKARSVGIHLIIATQRPSTDVISGTIKNNIPCRIAFYVKSFVDSQTVLDHGGAEKLLGSGDMLLNRGNNDIRVQGAYIDDKELDRISQYFMDKDFQKEYMFTHDDIRKQVEQSESESGNSTDPTDDPLFDEIARFVFRSRKASANQIQTIYGIGFNRANKVIIALAQLGIVSSENIPGKAREVIIKDIDELEQILRDR